jgi:hypothetical protein
MLLFIQGSFHYAFLRAGPCTPAPLSSHSLSHRQPGPVRQPRRRATAETEACRGRATVGRDAVGTLPAGWSQAPCGPRTTWRLRCRTPPPLSAVPRRPLERSHRPLADFLLPRASFISPVQARAPHTLPPPPRHLPRQLSTIGAPPPRRTPSERHRRPLPSGEHRLSCSVSLIGHRLLTPLVSLELQDLSTLVDDHQSYLAAIERRRPTLFAPPHHRRTVSVRPCPVLLARHLPCVTLEISGNILPPLSHRQNIGERATTPSRAW